MVSNVCSIVNPNGEKVREVQLGCRWSTGELIAGDAGRYVVSNTYRSAVVVAVELRHARPVGKGDSLTVDWSSTSGVVVV
jgi:hypothetical protein